MGKLVASGEKQRRTDGRLHMPADRPKTWGKQRLISLFDAKLHTPFPFHLRNSKPPCSPAMHSHDKVWPVQEWASVRRPGGGALCYRARTRTSYGVRYFVRAGGTPGLRAPWQATPDAGRFWMAQQTATAMRCAVPAMRCMQSARMREDGSLTGRLVATPSGRQSDAAQSPRRRNPTLRRRATRLLLDSLTLPPDHLESILRPPTLDQRLPGRKWQIPPPPRFAEASGLRPRRRARLGEWWAGLGPASQRVVVCPMGTKGTK